MLVNVSETAYLGKHNFCSQRAAPSGHRHLYPIPCLNFKQNAAQGAAMSTPKQVSVYTLSERIGTGSFATVFKAYPTQAGPDAGNFVAVKAITVSRLSKKLLEAIESEIDILAQLKHPNIVQLLSHQKTKQHVYVILEYCPGGDLSAYIKRSGPLSGQVAHHFMVELSRGLSFLWGQALVHRDLKPHNLLLTTRSDTASLKIADFGFARHLSEAAMAETLCGSPLYMAPEILKHERYDAKADLWSTGVILYEMLVGRPPFAGSNPHELLVNIVKTELRIPSTADASDEAIDLLRRLLKVDPTERISFQDFFSAAYFQAPKPPRPAQLSMAHQGATSLLLSSSSSSPSPSSSNAASASAGSPPRHVPLPARSGSPSSSQKDEWEIVEEPLKPPSTAVAPAVAPLVLRSLDPSGRALTFAVHVGERAVYLAQQAERIVDLYYSEHASPSNEAVCAAALVVESMRLLSLARLAADDAVDAALASTSTMKLAQVRRARAVAAELGLWFQTCKDKAEKLLAAARPGGRDVPGARKMLFKVALLLGRRAASRQLLQGLGDCRDEEDYAFGLMILQVLSVHDDKTLPAEDRRVLNGFLVLFTRRCKATRAGVVGD